MSTGATHDHTEAVHPDLAGGLAVISGGGRGLGRSMAGALARQGMHVAIPAGRMGEPADLDGLVASLASSSSG
jgi:NAD(P)-dependent dehydrogenase (short-subunit alcohol dehydrogenase family)